VGEVIDFTKEVPRTIGSAVEHHIDIVGVTGSIPVSSTQKWEQSHHNQHQRHH
jgi:hypothetical protein